MCPTTSESDLEAASLAPHSLDRRSVLPAGAAPTVEEDVDEEERGGQDLDEPYDPSKTHILTKPMSMDLLIRRLGHGEIDLQPEFQRKAGLWSAERMSRLVESILIRIPLPVFYFDATDDARWLVIDGLQRLSTLDAFVVKRTLRLSKLEYLRAHEGKLFNELPRDLQRRIEETQVLVHLIQPGTPGEVKYNIFRRINTGGLVLTAQEIRHALNQGPATELLGELARSPAFVTATDGSVDPDRMIDRELVLRFVAFTRTPASAYRVSNLDLFLTRHMEKLNRTSETEREELRRRFERAMTAAHAIFGPDAFRKRYDDAAPRHPINKALFEAWAVLLGARSDDQLEALVARRGEVVQRARELLTTDSDFEAAVSRGTADVAKVQKRFGAVEALLESILAKSAPSGGEASDAPEGEALP